MPFLPPDAPLFSLTKGRMACPKCERKGLGYSQHAGDARAKDYGIACCCYCHTRFRILNGAGPGEQFREMGPREMPWDRG